MNFWWFSKKTNSQNWSKTQNTALFFQLSQKNITIFDIHFKSILNYFKAVRFDKLYREQKKNCLFTMCLWLILTLFLSPNFEYDPKFCEHNLNRTLLSLSFYFFIQIVSLLLSCKAYSLCMCFYSEW